MKRHTLRNITTRRLGAIIAFLVYAFAVAEDLLQTGALLPYMDCTATH